MQRREPFRDEVLVRRERVVRQRLPVGQEAHARVRREIGDFDGEALRIDGARAQNRQKRHLFAESEVIARDGERVGGTGGAIEDEALARFDECDRRG